MMRRFFTSTNVRLIPILLSVLLAFALGCASTPDSEPAEDAGDAADSEKTDPGEPDPDAG